MLLFVLQQHRLTKQITQRDSKRPRHIRKHIKPTDLPLATLDLAQPILSATHQVSENDLGQPAATPVEGNTLANAELITCTTHVLTLSTAPSLHARLPSPNRGSGGCLARTAGAAVGDTAQGSNR
jgi:hypothetical protein